MSLTAEQILWMPDVQQKHSFVLQSDPYESSQLFEVFSPSIKLSQYDSSIKSTAEKFSAKSAISTRFISVLISTIAGCSSFDAQLSLFHNLGAALARKGRRIKGCYQSNKIKNKLKNGL